MFSDCVIEAVPATFDHVSTVEAANRKGCSKAVLGVTNMMVAARRMDVISAARI
jgi:hypothetical protein